MGWTFRTGSSTQAQLPPLSPPDQPEKSGKKNGRSVTQVENSTTKSGPVSETSDTPIRNRSANSSDHITAGRGVVRVTDSGAIEKQMTKWEIINYSRIAQRPENKALVRFLPKQVTWENTTGRTLDLKDSLPDEEYRLFDLVDSDHLMPVQMTNVSPSGTALDVKLGDLNCYKGDQLHEKVSFIRYVTSRWHNYKQKKNKSAVTIQTTTHKFKRELSELRQDRDFIKLIMAKADFTALDIIEIQEKIQQLVNQLLSLREAVELSNIGFVGCSLLLSFSDQDQKVTLIDLENCILPEDISANRSITQSMIDAQKANFITGIDTLIQHLSDQLYVTL